jgi:hypothetical protein
MMRAAAGSSKPTRGTSSTGLPPTSCAALSISRWRDRKTWLTPIGPAMSQRPSSPSGMIVIVPLRVAPARRSPPLRQTISYGSP